MIRECACLAAAVACGLGYGLLVLLGPDYTERAAAKRGPQPAPRSVKPPIVKLVPAARSVAAQTVAASVESASVEQVLADEPIEKTDQEGVDAPRGDATVEVVLVDERGRTVSVERAEVELVPWSEEARTRVLPLDSRPPSNPPSAPRGGVGGGPLEPGAWTATLHVEEPADLGAERREVRLASGANRLVFVVKKLGYLRGVVRSAVGAKTPVEVSVEPAAGDVVHLVCDPEGRFEWRGLGAATIRAEAEGHGMELARVELGSGSVREVALDLRPGTALAVSATFADGKPAAFEEVVAWPEGEPERAVRAALDEEGRAALCLGGSAPYHVTVAGRTASSTGGAVTIASVER